MNQDLVEYFEDKIKALEQQIANLSGRKTIYVKRKKLSSDCIYPTKNNASDAGYDLFASEDTELEYGVPTKVSTGLALQIPEGYYASIRDRSGMGSKGIHVSDGIHILGGVCDSGYTGEYKVILIRLNIEDYDAYFDTDYDGMDRPIVRFAGMKDGKPYQVKKGDKIAQVVFTELPLVEWSDEEFNKTDREDKGFGSSGR